MRILLIVLTVVLMFVNQLFSQCFKKSKSEVKFNGFGKYTTIETQKITGDKKRTDSDNSFKGEGLTGRIAAKLFLKSGEEGEIIDLPEMTIYRMDHKKKEYWESKIEKMEVTEMTQTEADEPAQEEEYAIEESDIRIIRSVFKVDDTGEKKKVNNFPSEKYTIMWVTEWENIHTSEKGTDSLFTIVWTTLPTNEMEKAQEEEMNFNKAYMESMGMEVDELQNEILGLNWLSILNKMSQKEGGKSSSEPDVAKEMKKIKGYPVVVDGNYYVIRPGEKKSEEGEAEVTDVKKRFGRFAKKAFKKKTKKKKEIAPAFSYYTELIEFSTLTVSESEFQVPANYKKKE